MSGEWIAAIPEEDLEVYAAAGYGERGRDGLRPALLIIDVTWGFVGRERLPVLESISQYPNSVGEAAWEAIPEIERVLQAYRALDRPCFYTAGVTDNMVHHAGRWREKHPKTLEQPDDAHEIVDPLTPHAGDIIIRKTRPSAFFGTPLAASLVDLGVDSVIVTGCTTSGCIRATVVDAFSFGFSVIVPEEAVFDRGKTSHAVNLFDMDQKYANVEPTAEVVDGLVRLEASKYT